MEPISIILTVAREIAGGLGTFRSHKKERREATAAYFEQIADTITAFSPRLLSGTSYHELEDLTERMRAFADQLPETVGDVLGKEKAEAFSKKLKSAYNAKSMLPKGEVEMREENLTTLAEAAGHLRASAISLQAASNCASPGFQVGARRFFSLFEEPLGSVGNDLYKKVRPSNTMLVVFEVPT